MGHLAYHTIGSNSNNIPVKSFIIDDQLIWIGTTDGESTCKSSWNNIRFPHESFLIDSMTWHKHMLLKISFLI
ncbi:hypothetical protein H5410_041410 [Solanum commersonii]|uniref:Uncharacterized protein n=1 Tax=Solanum commersonii TaxID=4109 RepID=A0A9J5XUP0_SOLCO|nr:hypothetical protein H5410_041410 [Solanum commersonii]